jgi:prepilin-type N-terminal cleavage/methylation domain-containing protein
MPRRHGSRAAFTLVELSIVLVIIGLIIGGVLTGQQIIQNAKITNAVNAVQAYQAAFQSYSQNYGVLPGDDPSATRRFSGTTGFSTNGDGDGTLEGTYDSSTSTDESRLAWADLRAAGLVKNQVTSSSTAVQPTNPFGGIYGFQTGAFSVFTTPVLCLNDVPAAAAQSLDTRLDDGVTDSGSIQANTSSATDAPTASSTTSSGYGTTGTYIVCVKM